MSSRVFRSHPRQTLWLALLTTALVVGLAWAYAQRSAPPQDRLGDRRLASAEELTDMLSTVLEHHQFGSATRSQPNESGPLLLWLDQTLACPAGVQWSGRSCAVIEQLDALDGPAITAGLPVDLLRLLPLASRAPMLRSQLKLPGVHVISPARLSGSAQPTVASVVPDSTWAHFQRNFPAASGYAQSSQAVVSADRLQALLLVSYHCGPECNELSLFLLQQASYGWIVVSQLRL